MLDWKTFVSETVIAVVTIKDYFLCLKIQFSILLYSNIIKRLSNCNAIGELNMNFTDVLLNCWDMRWKLPNVMANVTGQWQKMSVLRKISNPYLQPAPNPKSFPLYEIAMQNCECKRFAKELQQNNQHLRFVQV